MADPGFPGANPRGGGAAQQTILPNFSKTAWNWKNLDRGRPKFYYVDPPLLLQVLIFYCCLQLAKDLLHSSVEEERRKCKLKRLVQSPNSYFMDVKCPGQSHQLCQYDSKGVSGFPLLLEYRGVNENRTFRSCYPHVTFLARYGLELCQWITDKMGPSQILSDIQLIIIDTMLNINGLKRYM